MAQAQGLLLIMWIGCYRHNQPNSENCGDSS
jgi:hypothetical protein